VKKVIYSKHVLKAFNQMPADDVRRIRSKFLQYVSDPSSMANNVKRLQGLEYYRLRVGDWRAIFREDGLIVDVIKVARRDTVYKGIPE
jgi:mRNA interferase RelE/StbE